MHSTLVSDFLLQLRDTKNVKKNKVLKINLRRRCCLLIFLDEHCCTHSLKGCAWIYIWKSVPLMAIWVYISMKVSLGRLAIMLTVWRLVGDQVLIICISPSNRSPKGLWVTEMLSSFIREHPIKFFNNKGWIIVLENIAEWRSPNLSECI